MDKPTWIAMQCLVSILENEYHNQTWHDSDPDAEILNSELDAALLYVIELLKKEPK